MLGTGSHVTVEQPLLGLMILWGMGGYTIIHMRKGAATFTEFPYHILTIAK